MPTTKEGRAWAAVFGSIDSRASRAKEEMKTHGNTNMGDTTGAADEGGREPWKCSPGVRTLWQKAGWQCKVC